MPFLLRLCFCLIVLTACSATVSAQSSAEGVMGAAVDAIRQGDAAKLSNHFSQKLEVSVPPNADGEYSKNQALFIFKEYFMNYPVKSFKLLHKGSSGKSYYAMGQYVSAKGRFDTNIFIKKSNGQYVIDEIRFEQAN